MSVPTLTFQLALGQAPTAETFTWTTIPGTQGVTYQRGAPNEFGRMETGESEADVGDAASDLDPNNPDAAYAPERMTPMRAFVTVDGVDYPCFQHYVERLPRKRSVGAVWTERAVVGVDAFASWALASLKGRSFPSQSTGNRWWAVLSTVLGVAASRTAIDTGNSILDAATFDENDGTKALAHLLDVAENENGFGYIDAEGRARFIQRHAAITDTTLVATLAGGRSIETGDYPGAIPYTDLQPESTEIINDYSGKREAGAAQTASDAASIDAYGPRSEERTFLVSTDAEVQSALEWRLSQTKDPHERIDALTVKPGEDLARWATVLGLDIGDRILVVEWPPGYAAPVETEFLIRHLSASIPASIKASEFTFQLTPAGADSWLILDDATAGRLDFNKLAY